MKATNGDIWEATSLGGVPPNQTPPPLQELLGERWPVKTAYWLARLARKLGGLRADIDVVRTGLIRQHGTTGENGQTAIKPGDEHWTEFVEAHNELMSQEIDIEGIDKIALPGTNGCECKPLTLLALEAFVDAGNQGN
ncbi:MAG: hypothetical protein Q7O66_16675 [Dehalococcoidia bacterium]|nr:hypothetical protein [Dehalococcoidia bacterium]